MLRQLSSSHDIGQSMIIPFKVWVMLCQLPSSHDNDQSTVIHLLGMKHAPSVVIVSWQRSEHGIYHISIKTCPASCLRLMTTDKAWLCIPKIWIMPHKLASSHNNGQSMIIPFKYESCSVSCHHLMTTVRAWLSISKVCNKLCQVSSSYDNDQSMEIYHSCMKHAPSVVIVLWRRSEHGNRSLRYQSCSVSCHRLHDNGQSMVIHPKGNETCSVSCLCLITTVRACLFIPKVWIMLPQLSSSHDNSQSMVHVIYHM